MKKIVVMVAAAAFLAVSCDNGRQSGAGGTISVTDSTGVVAEVSSLIAYIDLEVVMEKYDMVIELGGALEEKATKADNELSSKSRSLERSLADAQEKVEKGLVTRAQAAELQEKLQRQEQSFYEYRDRVQRELAEENQVMMNNIYHSLNTFIEDFNSDYRYGVILTTTGISPILHADPRLDITDLVVEGLNKLYASEKNN